MSAKIIIAVVVTAALTSTAMYLIFFSSKYMQYFRKVRLLSAFIAVAVMGNRCKACKILNHHCCLQPIGDAQGTLEKIIPDIEDKHALGTSVSCQRLVAWGDICVYTSLCWDGKAYLLVDGPGLKGRMSSTDDMVFTIFIHGCG